MGSQGRNSRHKLEAGTEGIKEHRLLTYSLWLCSIVWLIHPRITCSRLALFTVGHAFSHQPLIQKVPDILPHGPIWLRHFLNYGSSSQANHLYQVNIITNHQSGERMKPRELSLISKNLRKEGENQLTEGCGLGSLLPAAMIMSVQCKSSSSTLAFDPWSVTSVLMVGEREREGGEGNITGEGEGKRNVMQKEKLLGGEDKCHWGCLKKP